MTLVRKFKCQQMSYYAVFNVSVDICDIPPTYHHLLVFLFYYIFAMFTSLFSLLDKTTVVQTKSDSDVIFCK